MKALLLPAAFSWRHLAIRCLQYLNPCPPITEPGEIGALLRREGLYSSYLSRWRRAREQGLLKALSPKKRGRKPTADPELEKEVADLRRENERLQKKLETAETIIEIQKNSRIYLGWTPKRTRGARKSDRDSRIVGR